MSTWEERMSARAQVRIRAEQDRDRARMDAEWAAEEAELEERYRPIREAGPPGGCHECWSWSGWHAPWGLWAHGESVQPGPPPDDVAADSMLRAYGSASDDDWCWHPCHDDGPACCIPVAYAAC
jgi:hypothetical protein